MANGTEEVPRKGERRLWRKEGGERDFAGGEGGEGLGTIKNANGLKVSRGKEEDDVVARGALGRPTDTHVPAHSPTMFVTLL